ncbi:MAG TPA: glycosyltransferase family 4 protein [Opitutaceae bacterium]|jgi:glycosyltransferase involved in cell wall biosynthesis
MRYVVVFAGARDHYQVAHALAEAEMLERFVTEFYGAKVPRWISRTFPSISSRLIGRIAPGVPETLVTVPLRATIAWGMFKACRSSRFRVWKDAIIGQNAGRIAKASGSGLLAYSYYASYAFEKAPMHCRKIIFQVHPHPDSTRKILEDELSLQPSARASLRAEHELNIPKAAYARLSQEARDADFALTPSTFAKQSLIAAGVSDRNIAVVPYGIDTTVFQPKNLNNKEKTGPLRLLFVGSLVQRKGLSYLLEAMRRLRGAPIELTLVGRGARDDELIKNFSDVPFSILWNLPRNELVEELQASDVFVFPSLVESFAHVMLEAMAVGLPIITTTNTAGPDLLDEGCTGFVGAIRDVEFLVTKIRWFLENRDAVAEMGRACQEEARKRTWKRFRQEIRMNLSRFQSR